MYAQKLKDTGWTAKEALELNGRFILEQLLKMKDAKDQSNNCFYNGPFLEELQEQVG